MQVADDAVEQWCTVQKLQLNADKCKELIIDFMKVKHHLDAVTVNSRELERIDSVKLFGVTITNTLQWNCPHRCDRVQSVLQSSPNEVIEVLTQVLESEMSSLE